MSRIENQELGKREEFIYVLPEIEVILPSEKIKGVQSVKIKLKNSAKKEILIYPISIDFKDNLLYIALSADKAKMVQDGKEFLMNGKRKYCNGYEWYYADIYDNPELLERSSNGDIEKE